MGGVDSFRRDPILGGFLRKKKAMQAVAEHKPVA
jgi:hypothetical protein